MRGEGDEVRILSRQGEAVIGSAGGQVQSVVGRTIMRQRLMTAIVVGVLAAHLSGCASSPGEQNIRYAAWPYDGKLYEQTLDGAVIQTTEWEEGKLVSCWEFARQAELVEGELTITEPVWMETVVKGNGKRTLYGRDGRPRGTEVFKDGEYVVDGY